MSFLKRRFHMSRAPGKGSGAAGPVGIVGSEPCALPGCLNHTGAECDYVDRRGRHCGYAWCPEHQVVLDNRPYCRRHAGVMRAISDENVETIEPPDLDNRALSLCEWVANDLDQDIISVLEEIKGAADGAVARTHRLRLVVERTPPSRTWARSWTLGDHTGTMRKVSVEVSESADNVVVAKVDSNAVASEVPPWITDRGMQVSEAAVLKRRDEFRIKLVGSIVWSAKNAERSWAPLT